MTDSDLSSGSPPEIDKALAQLTDLPEPLPGDPRRQAVSSIQGTVYQAWWSIDAWLQLANIGEVIYLEGAEDFDIVRSDDAIAVQVKHHTGTISLGTAKAREALENFWILSCQEDSREIDFHYLTTSSIAQEQDSNFDVAGIDLWRAAQTNPDIASKIATFLESKLEAGSALRAFLASSTPDVIQSRLFQRFHWLTNQPDLDVVKGSVEDRITVILHSRQRPLSLVPNVRRYLEARFWEIVLEENPQQRCLTFAELLRQIEAAITAYVPVPVEQLHDLISGERFGLGILDLLLEKSPVPPDPLLQRPNLTQQLEELIELRKIVLLTGTVHKGKTTIAQLVASTLCPEAWWINLTERRPDQVDNLFLSLARRIDSGDCPSLIVVDDLEINPDDYRVYKDSLALVLLRATSTGRGIVITSRGAPSENSVEQFATNIVVIEVPELSSEEIESLCIEQGCPPDLATTWAPLIELQWGGHPKLVQVRLAELSSNNWPSPNQDDLTSQSSAVTSAKQMARQLLSSSVPNPSAELVYLMSESSILIHRSVAINLAEAVDGITNAGDIIDSLTGKWFECIENQWFRVTALLKGTASEVWSQEKRQQAHIKIHAAILAKGTLSPSEAAALLFHAYIGKDPRLLTLTAIQLQQIDSSEAVTEVDRQLLWLPYVALGDGQSITNEMLSSVTLRSLQFRVAKALDPSRLPEICARWSTLR